MPRKMRNAKTRNVITRGQIQHLINGYDYFSDGFGGRDGEPLDETAMREVWQENRQTVIEHAQRDHLRADWPIYAELRFDRKMSREKALAARSTATSRRDKANA